MGLPDNGDMWGEGVYKTYFFRAETDAIRSCANEYFRLADTNNELTRYLDNWLNLSASDAMIYQNVRTAVNAAHTKLTANAARLRELVYTSAMELDATADMYERTDRDSASNLDHTYSSIPGTL
ncbi:type VII secretion target [Mycobacteroides chelonae]|jgi:hypothetical protein|nr:type VII secretion target [Mycobacteroides chelonae]SKL38949.1 Protein of uncharacterised function (DUF2580) [Mycobacteroides abscessus subsp. bolletii]MBF9318312.1 hypothetical protein [Mycobacteroides chelonae]MBF9329656.1 hypothetical protein [Mycobacteroides chelonae]MBF9423877.1 hypothetical protein [Mycobacteroides chelonae]MBV6358778.1 hypothetical protein [Mycobacteroides chelonae]